MSAKLINTLTLNCELGEGICYSCRFNCVFWVDIKKHHLYRMCYATREISQVNMPEKIGWIKETRTGRFLVGLRSGIYWLNEDFSCGECFLPLTSQASSNRLNDAKTDREGRLYFGTMDDEERSATGHLYQLVRQHNQWQARQVDTGYQVSNGPAVNLAGNKLYSVSSASRTIYSFEVDNAGQLSNKTVFITLPDALGYPDGLTVDSHDNLWVACWQGHSICCFSPQGNLISRIMLPAPLITNVTFAGPDSSIMFVTSARTGLSDETLKIFPLSGSVFEIDAGVAGLPEPLISAL